MAAAFDKVHIKLRGYSVPIDKRFLDALSIIRFNKPYDEAKEQTNSLLRDLVGYGDRIHPQDVHFTILQSIMPKTKASMVK